MISLFDNSLKRITSVLLRQKEKMQQGSVLVCISFIKDFHWRQYKTRVYATRGGHLFWNTKHSLEQC